MLTQEDLQAIQTMLEKTITPITERLNRIEGRLENVEAKQMELKRIRLHRLLERVKAEQSVKEGNSNENVSSSIDGKMECL